MGDKFLNGGLTLIVEDRKGKVIYESKERGLYPLVACVETHLAEMEGGTVKDKVVGRAAALLLSYAKVSSVYVEVASDGAIEHLAKAGIRTDAETIVPAILNGQKTDVCPMEKLSRDYSDGREFLKALKARCSQ